MLAASASEVSSVDGHLLRAHIGIKKGVICICAKIIFSFQTLEMTERTPQHTPLGFLFVSMPVWLCECWCCCGVTGLSQGFCVTLSYVKLHLHRRLCLAQLSMLSRGSAPPSSYLSNCLNCGPQCRDPVTFTNNREINSAPPIPPAASHPANEGTARGLSLHPDNTQSLLIPRYR